MKHSVLLCKEEGLTESLPSQEMFEPGVPNKRPHRRSPTCSARVCSPRWEGPPGPLRSSPASPHSRLQRKQSLTFRDRCLPSCWGLPRKSPALGACRPSQTTPLSDENELRPLRRAPQKARTGAGVPRLPHTPPLLPLPACHSHGHSRLTAINLNTDSQGLPGEGRARPASQCWDWGCN